MRKECTYRGRKYLALKQNGDMMLIENIDGYKARRWVMKDDVVYDNLKMAEEVFEKDETEKEVFDAPEDVLQQTSPEPKDLLSLKEKIEAGTYVVEITYPYKPEIGGQTTLRVTFDIYGQYLEELNIISIKDVDTGELLSDITGNENLSINDAVLEKEINTKLMNGEFIKKEVEPDEIDERTVSNTGQEITHLDAVDDLKDTHVEEPQVSLEVEPEVLEPVTVDENMPISVPNKGPGIDVSTETTPERQVINKETIRNAIVQEFKNSIQKELEEMEFQQPTQNMYGNSSITTELDSGREVQVFYDVVIGDPTANVETQIDVVRVIDTLTNKEIEFNSLPFEEQQEILGAIKGQEDMEI